jgi:hypothetical protein
MLLQRAGEPDPPVNSFAVAKALGFRVFASPMAGARLVGATIEVCAKYRRERQQFHVAHELAHVGLRWCGLEANETSCDYVAGAVLLPRREFDRDLKETAWDVRALRAKHVNASAEVIARRIVTMRDAVACIFDNGKLKTRVVSPWLPEGYRRISAFERSLADEVLENGATVHAGNLVWGFAVFSGNWRRVITVCEAEQLALRY